MWIKKRSHRTRLCGGGRAQQQQQPSAENMEGPLKKYERVLAKSCEGNDKDSVPNAAVISADATGKILHSFSTGTSIPTRDLFTPEPSPSSGSAPTVPFTLDTVCWIASCTKVMATVAALQCVERGLLSLDAPVESILPELKDPQILVKIDRKYDGPNSAQFKTATKKITLRQLLTHSSGLSYEFTHPKILAWRKWFMKQSEANRTLSRSSKAAEAYLAPLLFEPGEGWAYGTGIDWAGVMVERVSGMSLGAFMTKNIFHPLGMTSTTFWPEKHQDILNRMASMTVRDVNGDGGLTRGVPNPLAKIMNVREGGGGACFSTARDYVKFLSALISPTCPIMKNSTRALMFSPHLAPIPKQALIATHASPLAFGLAGNIPIGTDLDFGLGGILTMEDVKESGRSRGSIQWGGLPNLNWWVNPRDGVCGCYFTQILPEGDRRSFGLFQEYEKAVMEEFSLGGKAKSRL